MAPGEQAGATMERYELVAEVAGIERAFAFASELDGYGGRARRLARDSDWPKTLHALIEEGLRPIVEEGLPTSDVGIVRFGKFGERRRYAVDALYADDGGSWGDHVDAVDDEDAQFQARWQCALNALDSRGVRGLTVASMVDEGFVEEMEAIKVTYVAEEAVTKDEALEALRAMVAEPGEASLRRARETLARAGVDRGCQGTT